jgi:hypothetical protein
MTKEYFIVGKIWTWLEFEYLWYMGHFCYLCLRYLANKNIILFAFLNTVFQSPVIECIQKAIYTTSKIQLLSTLFTLSVQAQTIHKCKEQLCVWNVVCIGYCVFCAARSKQADTSTACMYVYVTTVLKITMRADIKQYKTNIWHIIDSQTHLFITFYY